MMKQFLILCIRLYQSLTWWVPHVCRFSPSCSHYGLQALQHHGVIRGGAMTILRVLRCHPFHPGGLDPVPGFGEDEANKTPRQGDTSAFSSPCGPEGQQVFQGESVPAPHVSPIQPAIHTTGTLTTGD